MAASSIPGGAVSGLREKYSRSLNESAIMIGIPSSSEPMPITIGI